MTPRVPASLITVIDDTMLPRHPNGDNDNDEEDDENGEDKEPPVVREPDEGE